MLPNKPPRSGLETNSPSLHQSQGGSLLRRYLPRTSDLSVHDQHELDNIAARLNTRPRKRLGYLTPSEVFNQLALH
jgi:IS30 family transposase